MTKPGVCVLCWAQCCLLLHSSWELWSCPSPLYFILSSLPSNKEPSILKVLWLFTDYACYKLYLKKCLKLFCWLLSGSCQYWPSWCSITLGCINIKDTFLCWLLDGFVNVVINRIGSKQSIPLWDISMDCLILRLDISLYIKHGNYLSLSQPGFGLCTARKHLNI